MLFQNTTTDKSHTIAHLHHAWEIFNRYGRTTAAAKRAGITCRTSHFLSFASHLPRKCKCSSIHELIRFIFAVFQFAYTSLFGFYCSYLFIRTGSLFPPLMAHSFCNMMGLPQIGTELRRWPRRKFGMWSLVLRPDDFEVLWHSLMVFSQLSSPYISSGSCPLSTRLVHGLTRLRACTGYGLLWRVPTMAKDTHNHFIRPLCTYWN